MIDFNLGWKKKHNKLISHDSEDLVTGLKLESDFK